MKKETLVSKDAGNKTVHVTRHFDAPVDLVWKSWTESEVLDKWWAPRPWKAETKAMDFSVGGYWLYAMVSPEGEKHWNRVDFTAISPMKSFSATSTFTDEEGNNVPDFPTMHWFNEFFPTDTGSKVEVSIRFDKDADMQKIIEMGFEGGFTMALTNLDELLA